MQFSVKIVAHKHGTNCIDLKQLCQGHVLTVDKHILSDDTQLHAHSMMVCDPGHVHFFLCLRVN